MTNRGRDRSSGRHHIACGKHALRPGLHRGTPIHVLLRQVLECTSIADVRDVVAQRAPGQSGNIMVGSAGVGGVNFEFAGQDVSEQPIEAAPFVHTNHHLVRDISAGTLTPNTRARHARARTLISGACPSTVDEIAAVLSDTNDADHPICAPYKPLLGTQIGTVSTVVMRLAGQERDDELGGQMHIRRGPVPDGTFKRVALNAG